MNTIFMLTPKDVIIAGVFLLVALWWLLTSLCVWVRQRICKHDKGVRETGSCSAICRQCRKNLGFIGTWRDKHKGSK